MIFKFLAGSKFPVDLYLELEYVLEPDNTRTSVSRTNERGKRMYYNDSPIADMLSTAIVGDPNSTALKGYAPAVGVALKIPSILNWVMGGLTLGEAVRATNRIKEQLPIFLRAEDTSTTGETESKQLGSLGSLSSSLLPEDNKPKNRLLRLREAWKNPNKGSKENKPKNNNSKKYWVLRHPWKTAGIIGVTGLVFPEATGTLIHKAGENASTLVNTAIGADQLQNNSNEAETDTVQQYSTPQVTRNVPDYLKGRTADDFMIP